MVVSVARTERFWKAKSTVRGVARPPPLQECASQGELGEDFRLEAIPYTGRPFRLQCELFDRLILLGCVLKLHRTLAQPCAQQTRPWETDRIKAPCRGWRSQRFQDEEVPFRGGKIAGGRYSLGCDWAQPKLHISSHDESTDVHCSSTLWAIATVIT